MLQIADIQDNSALKEAIVRVDGDRPNIDLQIARNHSRDIMNDAYAILTDHTKADHELHILLSTPVTGLYAVCIIDEQVRSVATNSPVNANGPGLADQPEYGIPRNRIAAGGIR